MHIRQTGYFFSRLNCLQKEFKKLFSDFSSVPYLKCLSPLQSIRSSFNLWKALATRNDPPWSVDFSDEN